MTKGVIIYAVLSFVFGATIFSLMFYILIKEEQLHPTKDEGPVLQKNVSSSHSPHVFGLPLDKKSIDVIVSFVLLISFLKMLFSVLLIIGIKKNKPGLVVANFSFGAMLCVLLLVAALLELLQLLWYSALGTVLFTFVMMERLSVVYSVYENMTKESDSNLLLEEDGLNDQECENIICH